MKIKNGVDFYKYAKKKIPGGTTLFSKRSELHLPDLWPAYYTKAKDTYVWDLKGKKFLDMFCAVGTNVLGYCNKELDEEVIKTIKKGIMSTLNSPEITFKSP